MVNFLLRCLKLSGFIAQTYRIFHLSEHFVQPAVFYKPSELYLMQKVSKHTKNHRLKL